MSDTSPTGRDLSDRTDDDPTDPTPPDAASDHAASTDGAASSSDDADAGTDEEPSADAGTDDEPSADAGTREGPGADAEPREEPAPAESTATEDAKPAAPTPGSVMAEREQAREGVGSTATAAAGKDRGDDRSLLRSPAFAWGVTVVALAVAAVAVAWGWQLLAHQRAIEEVSQRAEEVALQVTTFRGEEIDEWVTQTQALSTGDYAEQVEGLFDDEFREALADNEVESTGEVNQVFVQELEGDHAVAFVVATQYSTNLLRDQPVEDELRMEITFERVDGEWLASEIGVLGPATGPADPLEEVPEDEAETEDADEAEDDGEGEDGEEADAEDEDEPGDDEDAE